MNTRAGKLPQRQQIKYLLTAESATACGTGFADFVDRVIANLPPGSESSAWGVAKNLLASDDRGGQISDVLKATGLFDQDVIDIIFLTGDLRIAVRFLTENPQEAIFDDYSPT